MALELRKYGVYICDQTARKLMKVMKLKCIRKSKTSHYNSYTGEYSLKPNILKRKFKSDTPRTKYVTDVSFIQCKDHNLYLSVFIDLFNSEVVSATIGKSPTTEFIIDGLDFINTLQLNNNCVIHSDQGCQYQSGLYQTLLNKHPNIQQSMSRRGNCYDNGACESFFGIMKSEVYLDPNDTYDTNAEKILRYLEYYNKFRCKSTLKGMSPTQYRMHYDGLLT